MSQGSCVVLSDRAVTIIQTLQKSPHQFSCNTRQVSVFSPFLSLLPFLCQVFPHFKYAEHSAPTWILKVICKSSSPTSLTVNFSLPTANKQIKNCNEERHSRFRTLAWHRTEVLHYPNRCRHKHSLSAQVDIQAPRTIKPKATALTSMWRQILWALVDQGDHKAGAPSLCSHADAALDEVCQSRHQLHQHWLINILYTLWDKPLRPPQWLHNSSFTHVLRR